jgi:hypothetical protein
MDVLRMHFPLIMHFAEPYTQHTIIYFHIYDIILYYIILIIQYEYNYILNYNIFILCLFLRCQNLPTIFEMWGQRKSQ